MNFTVRWGLLRSFLLLTMVTGCSVNEFGTSRASRWEANGVVGYRLEAFGFHLDTRDQNPSLTLGHFEAVHLFAVTCDDITDVSALTTRELFRIVHPQASFRRSLGVEFILGSREASITIGLHEQARLISLDNSADVRRSLTFTTDEFHESALQFEGACRVRD